MGCRATPVVLGHVGTKDKADASSLHWPRWNRRAALPPCTTTRFGFYPGRVGFHHTEVPQTLQTLAGQIHQGGVGRRLFKLTQLPAKHFIIGFCIATEIDAAHVNLATRLHIKGHVDGIVFIIGVVIAAVDLGKGITLVTKTTFEQVIA